MCNQVRGFHHGVWKFINAKIRMAVPNCAGINLCLHSYIFPSQTELKVIGVIKIQYICLTQIQTRSSTILSDGSLSDILIKARIYV